MTFPLISAIQAAGIDGHHARAAFIALIGRFVTVACCVTLSILSGIVFLLSVVDWSHRASRGELSQPTTFPCPINLESRLRPQPPGFL